MSILRVKDENGNIIPIPAIKGDKGDPGKSPVVGVDYFTDADKQEIVEAVLAAMPTWNGGAY